jgi:hypothetical protein
VLRSFCHILLFGLALAVAGCGTDIAKNTHPDPVQIFREREAVLRKYVRQIDDGQIKQVESCGYPIPQSLIDAGVKAVTTQDGCVVITFWFLPTDAVPELWYSPRGFDPLPKGLEERKRENYFESEQLTPDWFFCKWDN